MLEINPSFARYGFSGIVLFVPLDIRSAAAELTSSDSAAAINYQHSMKS
jgi:hypothetical protein